MSNTTHAADKLSKQPTTTKINIRSQDRATGSSVDIMVNGLKSTLAVGEDIEVPDYVVETLNHSHIAFDVVGGDGGVSSSSTAPLTDTATRAEPNVDPLVTDDGGEPRQVPELGQDNGAPGVGGAVATAIEPEAKLAATNAEGQGAGADGSDQLGDQQQPETDTATRSDDAKPKKAAAKKAPAKRAPAKKKAAAETGDTADTGSEAAE